MRYLLERPRPDELLTSVLTRTVRTLPFTTSATLASLRGTERGSKPGLLSFPFVHQMASAWRAAPLEIIWRHTMVPYATAFVQADAYDRAMRNALSSEEQRSGLGAVTQSISAQVPLCRFCRICAEEDVAAWGDSYWRRAHHLPGVMFCPTHRCPLTVTTIPTLARVLIEVLPHELQGPRTKWAPSRLELRLAHASLVALNRPIGPPKEPTAAAYRAAMVRVGLLSQGSDVDTDRLKAWVKEETLGEQFARLIPDSEGDLRWAPRLLTRLQCAQNPAARHLLFSSLIAAAQDGNAPLLDFRPIGPRRSRMVEQDAHFAAAAKKAVRDAIKRGERVRVCDVLQQVGCWSCFRHRRHDFPKLQAFILWLKSSPACARPNWGHGGTPRARSVMRMRG